MHGGTDTFLYTWKEGWRWERRFDTMVFPYVRGIARIWKKKNKKKKRNGERRKKKKAFLRGIAHRRTISPVSPHRDIKAEEFLRFSLLHPINLKSLSSGGAATP